MTIEKFKRESKYYAGFYITDNVIMFTKQFGFFDERTNEKTKYKTLDEALEHKIDGKTAREIIETLDELHIPDLE